MRKLLGIVAALGGGYLLYWAFKLGRVLLILEDKSFDGTMMVITAATALIGIALMTVGWHLFRDRVPPAPPTVPGPPTQP